MAWTLCRDPIQAKSPPYFTWFAADTDVRLDMRFNNRFYFQEKPI